MTAKETWIVYKTETMSARGWEDRKLFPSKSLTDMLAEEWDCSGKLPQVGDRVREYTNLEDPDNGITHGRDGDWVVIRLHQFSSFDTDRRVVIAYCQYQPVEAQWQELRRGAPVDELLKKG